MKKNANINVRLFTYSVFLFAVFFHVQIFSQPNPGAASKNKTDWIYTDSLKMGMSLFSDANLSVDASISCNSCHYSVLTDSLNWNPSVLDLALKSRTTSMIDFEDVFYLPMTNKLLESHDKFDLNSEQIQLVKYYLDHADLNTIMKKERKFDMGLFLFLGSLLVFILVLIDLVFTRFIKYKYIHVLLLLLSLSYCLWILYSETLKLGLQEGYEPDQPIKFSHKIHSEQNGTDCFFCHMPAKRSPTAGIPGVNICLNCHAGVVEGKRSGGFEISKLLDYKKANKTIPWIRVNNLPDHVFFNHSSHVNGGVDCAECHIGIENMDRTSQEQELSMIWCLDCHMDRKINIVDNGYYSNYRKHLEENKLAIDSATVYQLGGWDCMNCHY